MSQPTPEQAMPHAIGPNLTRLFDDALEREKAFWLEKLSGGRARAGIPQDGDSGREARRVTTCTVGVDVEVARLAWERCNGRPALMFTLMVAALKLCLHKYTGVRDLLVGSAIHDRQPELARLNRVITLRTVLDPAWQTKHFLEAVRDTVALAFAHQKLSFERLQDLLAIRRTPDDNGLFDVALVMEGVNSAAHLEHLGVPVIDVRGTARTLSLAIRYDMRTFRESTIARFGEDVLKCLRFLIEHGERPLAYASLHTADEIAWLTRPPTPAAYDLERTVMHEFEDRSRFDRDAIAASCDALHLTFGGLRAHVHALTQHLIARGVEPGSRVGICLHHSEQLVIALLAVLNAGAAYVPLDPRHPQARAEYICDDAGVAVVVTEIALAARFVAPRFSLVLVEQASAPVRSNHVRPASAADCAYVMYTSGSTGVPKGVSISHRSLANYVAWARDTYLGDRKLNFALYSSVAFDLTVTSIFVPLLAGGAIHVFPPRKGAWPLTAILAHGGVDALKLTPSHLRLLVDDAHRAASVRLLVVGGENLDRTLAEQAMASLGAGTRIYNEYGPTEATVGCMIHLFNPDADARASVPIGVAAPRCQILVLDANLQPTPVNAVGEMFISGAQLSSGYVNQPDLTARHFVHHPLPWSERMYRTGDLARVLPDGTLAFLGRRDEQVKFNGHRIELNEIRSVLNSHPDVRDSVIRVLDTTTGGQILVAYYASSTPLEDEQLREWIGRRIIQEIVPQLFAHLVEIPLTVNGKVDLESLPSLEEIQTNQRTLVVAPRTAVEQQLAAIWADVLGLSEIGVHDNFFELGGHSLFITQIAARVRRELGHEVPVARFFDYPTIAELASHLDEISTERVPALTPSARDGVLPLSFAQQRLWFAHHLDARSAAYNIPHTTVLSGVSRVPAMELAYAEVVRRHETLRSAFPSVDGAPTCRIHPSRPRAIRMVDLSGIRAEVRDECARRLAHADTIRPFDLERGPTERLRLLLLEPSRSLIVLTVTHIVSDAWSMSVLASEWTAIERAYAGGSPSPRPELSIQYVDYARWQRRRLESPTVDGLLDYWRTQLRDLPVLELPGRKPRPSAQRFQGQRQALRLTADVSQRVRGLSAAEEASPFITLLTLFFILLHGRSGQRDLVVGTDVAGRTQVELESLIGLFVNQLVLRTDIPGDPDVRTLLRQVKRMCLDAYAHQDLPFDRLVDALRVSRDLGRHPLFQVMFSFQNTPLESFDLASRGGRMLHVEKQTAVFDVSVYMMEDADGFVGWVRYDTSLFTSEWAAEFADDYAHIVDIATASLERPISAILSSWSDDQRRRRHTRAQNAHTTGRERLKAARRRAHA